MVYSTGAITYGIRPLPTIIAQYCETSIPEEELPSVSPEQLHTAIATLESLKDELLLHVRKLHPTAPTDQVIPTEPTSTGQPKRPLDSQQFRLASEYLDRITEDIAVCKQFESGDMTLDNILADTSTLGDMNLSWASQEWTNMPFGLTIDSDMVQGSTDAHPTAGSGRSEYASVVQPQGSSFSSVPSVDASSISGIPPEATRSPLVDVHGIGSVMNGGEAITSTITEYFIGSSLVSNIGTEQDGPDGLFAALGGLGKPSALCVSSSRVYVGTTYSLILVYENVPNGPLRDTLATFELIRDRNYHGAVTALALSPDKTVLVAGHTDGSILLWNLEKRTTIKSLPPVAYTGTPDSSLASTDSRVDLSIVQLLYIGVGHSRFISGDACGRFFFHSFTHGLLGVSVSSSQFSFPFDCPPTAFPAVPPTSEVTLALRALPYGPVPYLTDRLGLLAVATSHRLLILQTRSRTRVVYELRWKNTTDISRSALSSTRTASLSWFPAVGKEKSIIKGPQLACSYQHRLRIYMVHSRSKPRFLGIMGSAHIQPPQAKSSGPLAKPLAHSTRAFWPPAQGQPGPTNTQPIANPRPPSSSLSFHNLLDIRFDEPILSVDWYNADHLYVMDIRQRLHVISWSGRQYGKTIVYDFGASPLAYLEFRAPMASPGTTSEEPKQTMTYRTYANTLRCHKGRLYWMNQTGVGMGTLLTWSERLLRLIDRGHFVEAIRCVTEFLVSLGGPQSATDSHTSPWRENPTEPRPVSPVLSPMDEERSAADTNADTTYEFVLPTSPKSLDDGTQSPAEPMLPTMELLLGLSTDIASSRSTLRTRLLALIRASLEYTFRTIGRESASSASIYVSRPDDQGLKSEVYSSLAAACVDACLAMGEEGDIAFLLDEVYNYYRNSQRQAVFLEVLEPYLVGNRIQPISLVTPDLVHDLIQVYYKEHHWVKRLETCLLHLDPLASFDIDRILHICRNERLDNLMIYTWNTCLGDFVRPLEEMVDRLALGWFSPGNVDDSVEDATSSVPACPSSFSMETSMVLVQRILAYALEVLAGRSYPLGTPLPSTTTVSARRDVFTYFFQPRNVDSLVNPCHRWPFTLRQEPLFDARFPALSVLTLLEPSTVVSFLDRVMELPDIAALNVQASPAVSTDPLDKPNLQKAQEVVTARQMVGNTVQELVAGVLERNQFYRLDFSSEQLLTTALPAGHEPVSFTSLPSAAWAKTLTACTLLYSFLARSYAYYYPLVYIGERQLDAIMWFLISPALAHMFHNVLVNQDSDASDTPLATTPLYKLASLPAPINTELIDSPVYLSLSSPSVLDERQVGVQSLLNMRMPRNVDNFLAGCERVGFYRVVELLNRALGRIGEVALSYLNDPNMERKRNVFNCLYEFLRLDDYEVVQDSTVRIHTDTIEFGRWRRRTREGESDSASSPTPTSPDSTHLSTVGSTGSLVSPSPLDNAPDQASSTSRAVRIALHHDQPTVDGSFELLTPDTNGDLLVPRSSFSSSSVASFPFPSHRDDVIATAYWNEQFHNLRRIVLERLPQLVDVDPLKTVQLMHRFWSIPPSTNYIRHLVDSTWEDRNTLLPEGDQGTMADSDFTEPHTAYVASYRTAYALVKLARTCLARRANTLAFPHLLAVHWLATEPRSCHHYLQELFSYTQPPTQSWFFQYASFPFHYQSPKRTIHHRTTVFSAQPRTSSSVEKVPLGETTAPRSLFNTEQPGLLTSDAWRHWFHVTQGFTNAQYTREFLHQWVECVVEAAPMWSVPVDLFEAMIKALQQFDPSNVYKVLETYYVELKITKRCYTSCTFGPTPDASDFAALDTATHTLDTYNNVYQSNVSLDRILELFDTTTLDDSVLWIWQRQGRFERALKVLLDHAGTAFHQLLEPNPTSVAPSGTMADLRPALLIQVQGIIKAAIKVALEASKEYAENQVHVEPVALNPLPTPKMTEPTRATNTDTKRPTEPVQPKLTHLWFTLLRFMMTISQRVLAIQPQSIPDTSISPSVVDVTSEPPKSHSRLVQTLSTTTDQLMQAVVEALLHSSYGVSLSHILKLLVNDTTGHPLLTWTAAPTEMDPATPVGNGRTYDSSLTSSTLSATYEQFRNVFVTIFDTYGCEKQLITLANALVSRDFFVKVVQLLRLRRHGWATASGHCAVCNGKLFHDFRPIQGKQSIHDKINHFLTHRTRPWLDPTVLTRLVPKTHGIQDTLVKDKRLQPALEVLGLSQTPDPDTLGLMDHIMQQYYKRNTPVHRRIDQVLPHLLKRSSPIHFP
ncbi:hypothetical protein IWQ61_003381 [Dispira simplex]|nr:hypothetical protein IWQ61_003381 [Dispira simplex]